MTRLPSPPTHQPLDSRVHRALLLGLIENGHCPAPAPLAAALHTTETEIAHSLRRLEANHAIVLHPGSLEPWVIHPFSTTPTLFWVESARGGWAGGWGPCIWCALGIATLVDGPVIIHTTLAGERDPCRITFENSRVSPAGLLAHFPIPVARAWDNVHRHCACTLVFESPAQIDDWCKRHAIPRGEVLALEKVAQLAQVWYADYLSPTWTKATAAQAAARFASVGLTSPHWRVPGSAERF